MNDTPIPYAQRPTPNLLYLHRYLTDGGHPVPTDLEAALTERGIILDS